MRQLLVVLSLLAGCSNVPPEVADLSTRLGEDMAVVHASYRTLIKQHYSNIRQQRLDYFENTFAPEYIRDWISDGRLVDMATGKVVYDESQDDFVAPTQGKEEQQLVDSVYSWSDSAIFNLQEKRKSLIDPIDKDEQELLASVDGAFARFFRGNAVISAHLNSLRKVQGTQDEILEALDLKDLRIKINQALAKASKQAQVSTADIAELNKKLDKGKAAIDKAKQEKTKQRGIR